MKLFYHFTQKNKVFPELSAKQKFYQILEQTRLVAMPNKGFFYDKGDDTATVAFTALDFSKLEPMLKRRSGYALCFQENKFKDSLGQVMYFTSDQIKEKDFSDDEKWLVDLAGRSYDFCWENEYRHKGDFSFSIDDILFAITPENERLDVTRLYHNLAAVPASAIYKAGRFKNPDKMIEMMIERYIAYGYGFPALDDKMDTTHIRKNGELVDDTDETGYEASDDMLDDWLLKQEILIDKFKNCKY